VQILFGVARRPTESAMFSWRTTIAEISNRTSCSEDRGYNGLGCYQVWKAVTFAVYSRINDSCSSTLHSSRCRQLFQQNNDRPHVARVSLRCLDDAHGPILP
jgi:hypothetical protein